jgi:ferric-dicitrate binding protein FerR (iron transport regulator)
MNIPSSQSGHWTDDELLAFQYGVGPSGEHLEACSECQARLAAMQHHRELIEKAASVADSVSPEFLAAQRRSIYQRLEQPVRWPVRRWAAGLATACILGGSVMVYEHNRQMQMTQERIADAKLAQEVTMMADDTGSPAVAPLEGLFE